MSSDKRKRFHRACALLREVNCGAFAPARLSGGRHKWGTRNPVIRYIIERGMARVVRVPAYRGHKITTRNTIIDTGVPWARGRRG